MNLKVLASTRERYKLAFKVGIGFALFGVLVSGLLVAKNWHQVKGSFLIKPGSLASVDGQIISSRLKKRKAATYYEITYEYRVASKTYWSDHVTFTYVGTSDPQFAIGYVNKYPEGATVKVFYDAKDPAFSVLEPEKTDRFLSFFLFLPALFFVVGFLTELERDTRRQRESSKRSLAACR